MLLIEFWELVNNREDFLLIIHKGHNIEQLKDSIFYLPLRDPELFFVDVNDSDGAQIALETSCILYPSLISFKEGKQISKEFLGLYDNELTDNLDDE